ncbi:hypothetical protein QBC47DRAFT_394541 [Echria macrotheca]|uniref:Secreted protein n=1 Tax=Echria macrotheca TaxID=438768 RepID=A0AAJ0F6E2_9PEZI|nr:hypothetical protein QBC47DRAFT_394541 [Echria macrotheca]
MTTYDSCCALLFLLMITPAATPAAIPAMINARTTAATARMVRFRRWRSHFIRPGATSFASASPLSSFSFATTGYGRGNLPATSNPSFSDGRANGSDDRPNLSSWFSTTSGVGRWSQFTTSGSDDHIDSGASESCLLCSVTGADSSDGSASSGASEICGSGGTGSGSGNCTALGTSAWESSGDGSGRSVIGLEISSPGVSGTSGPLAGPSGPFSCFDMVLSVRLAC